MVIRTQGSTLGQNPLDLYLLESVYLSVSLEVCLDVLDGFISALTRVFSPFLTLVLNGLSFLKEYLIALQKP